MPRIAGPTALALALVLLVGCAEEKGAGAGTAASPEPTEAPCPAAERIDLVAEGHSFGTDCLAVASNRRVRGSLESLDFEPHNFALYLREPGPTQKDLSPPNLLVRSDNTFPGEPTSFRIPRLSQGQYLFRCDFHPEMRGTLHAV